MSIAKQFERMNAVDIKNRGRLFLYELFALYDKYDLSIAHEDIQGAFIIDINSANNREWMRHAFVTDKAKGWEAEE